MCCCMHLPAKVITLLPEGGEAAQLNSIFTKKKKKEALADERLKMVADMTYDHRKVGGKNREWQTLDCITNLSLWLRYACQTF